MRPYKCTVRGRHRRQLCRWPARRGRDPPYGINHFDRNGECGDDGKTVFALFFSALFLGRRPRELVLLLAPLTSERLRRPGWGDSNWNVAVPNGDYQVEVDFGEDHYTLGCEVEGVIVCPDSGACNFVGVVTVSDGQFTVTGHGHDTGQCHSIMAARIWEAMHVNTCRHTQLYSQARKHCRSKSRVGSESALTVPSRDTMSGLARKSAAMTTNVGLMAVGPFLSRRFRRIPLQHSTMRNGNALN